MMWGDEPYVRVYRRDTVDLIAMGWEARACFWELLRHADRSGTIELGKHGMRGLAALLHMPSDVAERAIPVLQSDGCIRVADDRIVIPNFLAAQEAPKSDAARKREERERKRDASILVTNRDPESRNQDATSRDVPNAPTGRVGSHEMSLLPSVPSVPSVHVRADAHASPDTPDEMPQFFVEAVGVVELGTGEKIDRTAAWIRYAGHRRANGKPLSKADAQQWLVTVDVKEAKRERQQQARTSGRNIKQAGVEDAPWRKAGA